MIHVRIELWHHGDPLARLPLATLNIANDGTGDEEVGHYDVVLREREGSEHRARVEDFPRGELKAADLVYRALSATIGER